MSMLGHTPRMCHTAQRALELIEECNFDLILSDFRMPVLNGQQFYQLVAAKHPELARRIVFLTGDLVNDDTRHFLESTGNPHLGKPFTLASIQKILEKILPENGESEPEARAERPNQKSCERNFSDRQLSPA